MKEKGQNNGNPARPSGGYTVQMKTVQIGINWPVLETLLNVKIRGLRPFPFAH